MDEDDEISNLVDLHLYMLFGGWKRQDLLRLSLVDHHGKKMCVKVETDIRQKEDEKSSQNGQNRARNGKSVRSQKVKVKSQPKSQP
ncbi:hypothetical protein Tco_0360521 [Tanacetum coccineum]